MKKYMVFSNTPTGWKLALETDDFQAAFEERENQLTVGHRLVVIARPVDFKVTEIVPEEFK